MFAKNSQYVVLFVAFLLFFSGCTQKKINIMQYPTSIEDKLIIPDACKDQYTTTFPTVAVMDFTNNSTFGEAEVIENQKTKKGSALAGVIVGKDGIGLGAVAQSKKNSFNVKRQVDAKLSQTLTPLLESKITQQSSFTLVTRNDIEKINQELQLQDSGLLDASTNVQLGKMLGARYIVTGSIDNVEINRRDNQAAAKAVGQLTSRSDNVAAQIVGAVGQVLSSVTDGILIKTTITIKVLDVQTAQILYTQTMDDDVNIGKFLNPTYDIYIGGIKAAIINSLEKFNYDFPDHFKASGYITQIRKLEDKRVVQINLGQRHKIKPHDRFKVYTFEQSIDPLTHQAQCNKFELPITLEATQHISELSSWLFVIEQEAPLKLLLRVEKESSKESHFALPIF